MMEEEVQKLRRENQRLTEELRKAAIVWNQANGSTPHRLQDATKLRSTAAVLPPLSLPNRIKPRMVRKCARRSPFPQHLDLLFAQTRDYLAPALISNSLI
jgi:hypothetical protein